MKFIHSTFAGRGTAMKFIHSTILTGPSAPGAAWWMWAMVAPATECSMRQRNTSSLVSHTMAVPDAHVLTGGTS
jgi:hypothetical protein